MLAEATPIFDGDKEFTELKKTFEATDSGTLYDAVNGHIFDDWKTEQLSAKRDCAFETNFRSAEVMDTVNQFQQQGYQATLIYFGLPEIKDAIERVKLRVKSGGHDVSLENIKANYTEGLKNLQHHFGEFDQVECYQNTARIGDELEIGHLMTINKGAITHQSNKLPTWLIPILGGHGKRKGLGL